MNKPFSTLILLIITTSVSPLTIDQPNFLPDTLTSPTTNPNGTYSSVSDNWSSEILSIEPVNGTCGCINVFGNCTCESSSLSCNISFFDGTWGILPFGASVTYTSLNSSGSVQTETYLCPIDYDPPMLIAAIFILAGFCFLILLCADCLFKSEYFQGNLPIKVYRYSKIMQNFWPAVHTAYTMGYLCYMLNNASFTSVLGARGTGTDSNDQSYIVFNSNWYANNKDGLNIPQNFSGPGILEVNGENCIIQQTTEGTLSYYEPFPNLGGVAVFFVVSLLYILYSIIKPDEKRKNYVLYCLATGLNIASSPWTWTAWDTCYAMLPMYDGNLYMAYYYLAYIEGALLIFVVFAFCCCKEEHVQCILVLMGLGGLVFRILTYFQIAIRWYPKVVLILDVIYHIFLIG